MVSNSEKRRIAKDAGLHNVGAIWSASVEEDVPFSVACALMQKESNGLNVYGNDAGGALAGFPHEVTEDNYRVFRWLVFDKGQQSNGVGPSQITSKGLLESMENAHLRPWVPAENMGFGLRLLRGYRVETGSWEEAGTRYNGSPAYGAALQNLIDQWVERFK